MKINARFLLLSFFILAPSCAYFVNRFDDNRLSQDILKFKSEDKRLYCAKQSQLQLVNSSETSQKAFKAFIKRLQKNESLKFVDKAALWALAQMNLRPDLASPTSKLQMIIKNGNNFDYFHFYSKKEDAYPYLYGLKHILEKYNSKFTLLQLASMIDRGYPNTFPVGKKFEDFLKAKKEFLAKSPVFKSFYMRADETLQENEKIVKYPLRPVIEKRLQSINSSVESSSSLFTYKNPSKSLTAHCNYDMKLYSNSIFLIHKDFIRSHVYGLKTEEGAFMASATQRLDKIQPIGRTLFFKGASQTRSAAFCALDLPSPKAESLWLASTDSRDPGQHIYHMIEYGIDSAATSSEVSEFFSFSRHLFLEDPTRLIFESNRSTKEQLERLLKLNLPVYNARRLGNVTGYLDLSSSKGGFIIDDRSDGQLTCER